MNSPGSMTLQTPQRSGTCSEPAIRTLGRCKYRDTYDAMRRFTSSRDAHTPDELWIVEHPPVFTVGVAGRQEHFPRTRPDIPLERIDRGGQITYHGPGQAIVYCLVDLERRGLKVQQFVHRLEQTVIDTLGSMGLAAERHNGAPGVYVGGAKIAALGLRVRRGACYHGLALNVDMDLSPFAAIDPCGYPNLAVTQTCDQGISLGTAVLGMRLATHLAALLDPLPIAASRAGTPA